MLPILLVFRAFGARVYRCERFETGRPGRALGVDGATLLLAAGLEAPTRDQGRPGVRGHRSMALRRLVYVPFHIWN